MTDTIPQTETPESPAPAPWLEEMPPRQIVAELDRYIVGQDAAKKAVAIAVRNRWRRAQAPDDIRDEITPYNIIMIGPTGVGKTEVARRLARLAGAPFIKVEASKFTEVGYVGRDAESMVRDLVDAAINMVRTEREDEVYPQAEQRADEVHSWNPLLIPGLFQIEPYARQIFRGAPAITPEEIEQRLRNRMRRQVVLTRQDGPMVLSLIDEGALHRPLGDADMMREQLGHLLKVAEHPRVTIQVLPSRPYSTTGLQAAFSIAVSCGSASTVYLESPPRGRTVGDRDMISTLLRRFSVIRAGALSEPQSICKIKEVMDGWT